jgi:hypothetical protein
VAPTNYELENEANYRPRDLCKYVRYSDIIHGLQLTKLTADAGGILPVPESKFKFHCYIISQSVLLPPNIRGVLKRKSLSIDMQHR